MACQAPTWPEPACRYVVLGAGCAGLSLAWHLLDAGVTGEITILDRRIDLPDDRTGCFWDARPHSFADLVTHCWHAWRVYGPDGSEVRRDGTALGYARLPVADFYARVLEGLS